MTSEQASNVKINDVLWGVNRPAVSPHRITDVKQDGSSVMFQESISIYSVKEQERKWYHFWYPAEYYFLTQEEAIAARKDAKQKCADLKAHLLELPYGETTREEYKATLEEFNRIRWGYYSDLM